jgi:hypothetical protein
MRVAFVAVVRALIVAGRHRAESCRHGTVLNVVGLNKPGESMVERFGTRRRAWLRRRFHGQGLRCALADPQRRLINLRLFVSLRGCGAITTATRKVQHRAVP